MKAFLLFSGLIRWAAEGLYSRKLQQRGIVCTFLECALSKQEAAFKEGFIRCFVLHFSDTVHWHRASWLPEQLLSCQVVGGGDPGTRV